MGFINLLPDDCYEKRQFLHVMGRLINGDELTISYKYEECR